MEAPSLDAVEELGDPPFTLGSESLLIGNYLAITAFLLGLFLPQPLLDFLAALVCDELHASTSPVTLT
jgi:hypothetical protein